MSNPVELLALTSTELCAMAAARLPRGAGLAPLVYRQAHREGRFAPEELGCSAATAAAWRARFSLALPRPIRRLAEPTEHGPPTEKLVLGLADGQKVECVRVPIGDRRESLCLSVQVGCRMGCRFCATGRMGRRRNLDAGEIVAQVVVARALGARPQSLLLQGMGEPLDNLEAVLSAIAVLTDRRGLGFAAQRITLCTVGRADGLARLAAQGRRRLNLAFSLHAADDALRRQLIGVARYEPLARLQQALLACRLRRNAQLAVHYCLLPGINDRREHAAGVAAFCAPLGRVLVHVIPYNPTEPALTRAPELAEVERFVAWLREEGLPVRRRIVKGRSVAAACGMLAGAAATTACGRGAP